VVAHAIGRPNALPYETCRRIQSNIMRSQVFWLLAPYALFTLAFGGIMVPKLNLIWSLVCKQYFADQTLLDPSAVFPPVVLGTDNPQCRIPEVQKHVAHFMLILTFCTGGLSAYVSPKMANWSNRLGRRRMMALASTGGLANELLAILAVKFPQYIDYRWLVLGSICDGITGSFTAGSILSQTYVSDCSPPSKRAVHIGYTHACLFSGLALGPLLAGYFVKVTGNLVSIFYVVLGCHLFFILFVGFVIPDSLSKKQREAGRERWLKEREEQRQRGGSWLSALTEANPLEPLKALWPRGLGTSSRLRRNLVILALTDTTIMGSSMAAGAVTVIYVESAFKWETFETSKFISALSMVRVFVLMAVFPLINYLFRTLPNRRRLQRSGSTAVALDKNAGADSLDLWVLRAALVSDIAGYVGYTLSRSPQLFVLSGMATAVGGLGSATSQAVVTKHVPPEKVGQVLGAFGMLQALARTFGPLVFNSLFAATVKTFPQAIFVLLASIFSVALMFNFALKPHVYWESVPEEETEPLNPNQPLVTAPTDELPLEEEDQVIYSHT
jgi:hypothetical protein